MQNSIDRQRLLRRYGQEPSSPVIVLAKCAAGIAILVGILLIGLHTPEGDVGKQAANTTTPPAKFAAEYPPTAAGSESQ